MKKILIFIILVAIALAGFDYYQRYEEKIKNLANNGLEKITDQIAALTEKKDVSTPGALRGSTESKTAFLTRIGTINQTNLQRQQNGLAALKENSKLDQAAMNKAKDMFAGQYFEHISPTGEGPDGLAKDVGYEFVAIGENLALGNFKDDAELVTAWMNSPGHRANILGTKYTEIGVAVLQGTFEGHKTWLAVQEFGKPSSACPLVDSNLKAQLETYKSEAAALKSQIDDLRAYLDNHDPKTQAEVNEYNQKVAEYNSLVKSYNNKIDWLKTMTAQYNTEVQAYNACVGS